MHGVLFAVKRTHLDGLRVERRLLERTGRTPARFHLVQAMARNAGYLGRVGCLQKELWPVLGVSRATVSRMLGSLEKLGLVQRSVVAKDRRNRFVELTRAGAAWFRLARRVAVADAARVIEAALGPRTEMAIGGGARTWRDVGMQLRPFETLLIAVQWRLGGLARLVYPRQPLGG